MKLIRRVSGVAILSMRHAELGSFAVPQEWTDRGALVAEPGDSSLMIDAFGLAELAAVVDFMTRDSTRD